MFRRIWKNEDGQAMVEYGLIIALIAIAVIVAIGAVSGGLTEIFEYIGGKLSAPATGTGG